MEAQWNDALKLSNEGDHAKAESIFKTIMWDVEQFAATLDKTEDPEQVRAWTFVCMLATYLDVDTWM